jgi:hypothetical protein
MTDTAGSAPFTVQFLEPSGFAPGTWSDDGLGNVSFAPFESFFITLPGGYSYTFDGVAGLTGPGLGLTLTGDITANSFSNIAGMIIDAVGNISCTSLSVGGVQVLTGQMAHIANLPGTPTTTQIATAFNQLLAELHAAKLMA